MTLVVAWVRHTRSSRELVIASDSCLSGGERWSCGPKLFPLSRGDAVFAFAGGTERSFPLIVQAARWAEDYKRARDRGMELHKFKGHVQRLMQAMLEDIDLSDLHPQPSAPEIGCTIVLAGYSSMKREFRVWTSRYDSQGGRFSFVRAGRNVKGSRGKHVAFVGDGVEAAKVALKERLVAKGRFTTGGLDWEPLEVLRDICRDPSFSTVRGPVQVVKLYDYMSSMPYAVRWRDRPADSECEALTLFGRRLLEYERTQRMIIDVDSLEVSPGWHFAEDCEQAGA